MNHGLLAFGIAVTAALWSLVGYGLINIHQAAVAITLIIIVIGFLSARRQRMLEQAMQALRASERHSTRKSDVLEATLENMSQGVILIEPDTRIALINRRAQDMLDLPDSLVNEELTIHKLIRWQWEAGEFGEDGDAIEPGLREFFLDGGLVNSPPVYALTRPNGTVLEVRTTMLPNGGAVRTFTDITGHCQAEQQLEAAKQAAEAGHRSKSAFLATMSHEIRTPLNAVVGMASLLLESSLQPEQRKSVETIKECSDVLLELINDVLDFSKFEAGRPDLDICAFNVLDLCEMAFNIIAPRAKPKNLTLVFAPSHMLPATIASDQARLRQVLLNLIGNAVKFTDNGAVILRAFPVETGAATQRIRFEIVDNGIGISDDARERLFTEFFQVEASINRRYGGSGLGLAICKKIVVAMGGEIGVDSEPGKGSVFWFEIPLMAPQDASAPASPQQLAGMKIAVIGDDHAARAVIADLVCELGADVAAGDCVNDIGDAEVAIVHVHHPLAIDLVLGKVPSSTAAVRYIGYGFGSLSLSGDRFRMIDGIVTPSSLIEAITGVRPAVFPEAEPRRSKHEATSAMSSLAILLAEDNAANQRIVSTMLRNMGHSVDIAGNGLDAITAAKAQTYDVILMDMQMPKMDGLDAAQAIRALGGVCSDVPIIAMTANAFTSDRETCLAAGMSDFLTKPVNARKLYDVLERWADKSRRADIAHSEPTTAEQPEDAPAPHPEAELIDRRHLNLLQDEVGEDAITELMIGFWTDAGPLLAELRQAMGEDNFVHASESLHTLESSASNLGLAKFAAACDRARADFADARTPDIDTLLTIMFETLQATQPYITGGRPAKSAAA